MDHFTLMTDLDQTFFNSNLNKRLQYHLMHQQPDQNVLNKTRHCRFNQIKHSTNTETIHTRTYVMYIHDTRSKKKNKMGKRKSLYANMKAQAEAESLEDRAYVDLNAFAHPHLLFPQLTCQSCTCTFQHGSERCQVAAQVSSSRCKLKIIA